MIKNCHLLFILILGNIFMSHAMEVAADKNYFKKLPRELLQEILMYHLLSFKHQKETFKAVSLMQQVENLFLLSINEPLFTQSLMQSIYHIYIPKSHDLSLDLHRLLCCNRESRNKYQETLKYLKTVAYYAVLHHNELTQEAEKEKFPWQNLEMGSYCTALRKSYRKIIEDIALGQNFSAIEKAIAHDYQKLRESHQPKVIKQLYPDAWNAYRITAELLYLCENTESIAQAALGSTNLSERLVQFVSLSSSFEEMFNNPFVCQPTYFRICNIFRDNNGSIKEEYLEKSRTVYTFKQDLA